MPSKYTYDKVYYLISVESNLYGVVLSTTVLDTGNISNAWWPVDVIVSLECSDTLPARNLLLNNVQSMQDLFTKVNINDILQFLQECDFYNKI